MSWNRKSIIAISSLSLFLLFFHCKPEFTKSSCDPTSNFFQKLLIIKNQIKDSSPLCGYFGNKQNQDNSVPPAAPVISNFKNNMIINTGFMIGTAGSDASSVEVSLDNGSYAKAVGIVNWKFSLPFGANTWKDNSKHTISVRALNSSGKPSTAISITVIKGVNKDFNGDGYTDIILGAPLFNAGSGPSQGSVYIFHSTGSNGIPTANATNANTKITGEASNNSFGMDVKTGDFNGDGYADAVVGAWLYNSGQGRVYIFHSSGPSGIQNTTAAAANTIITGESGNSTLGVSIASGDINGDGYSDLLIGSNSYLTNTGRAYIFHSSGANGITSNSALSANTILTGETTNNEFGNKVLIGDINGDGYSDVIVSAWKYNNTYQGRVYLFYSTGNSGVTTANATSAFANITGEAANNYFGASLLLTDLNADGLLDLVVGAHLYGASNQGRIYIFHNTGTTIATNNTNATVANTILTASSSNFRFGFSLASGDFNGDSIQDLVVGAYEYNSFQGAAYFFYNTTNGITATSTTAATTFFLGESIGDQVGISISAGDYNGDGFSDVLMGANKFNASQGRAYILHSVGVNGINPVGNLSSSNSIFTGETGSGELGTSLF